MRALYRDWVLEHSRHPRHHGPLAGATHRGRCDNPLCGDRLEVSLVLDGARVARVAFEGRACAVAVACASRMTELVEGQDRSAVRELVDRAREAVDPSSPPPTPPVDHLEVARRARSRRRCATLGWEALAAALDTPVEEP
jgi:nitrogen fixation protein NifU and related proteins